MKGARDWLAAAGAILGLVAGACGGAPDTGGSGGGCPNDLPTSCPMPEPSYSADVAALIQQHCLECHAPGGQSADRPLTSYDDVFARRSEVLDQVYACRMPPAGSTPLTESERQTLLGWLVCEAPDN